MANLNFDEILNPKSEENHNYGDIFKGSILNLKEKPERPPIAISIGYDKKEYNGYRYPLKFGSFGNISVIGGEEKSRKTWFKSLLLGCALSKHPEDYSSTIKGHDLDDKFIIDIDTEQSPYDNWVTSNRIPRMIGSEENLIYPENYISLNLREQTPKIIQGTLEWLFMESEYRNKLGIVSIDGFVDCVNDFNNNVESLDFTRKLMRYTSISKCHLTGVMHLNPASIKIRGHLGTVLGQKAEMVAIVKDMGEFSQVSCKSVRGSKKFEDFGISVNNNWLPYEFNEDVNKNWIDD